MRKSSLVSFVAPWVGFAAVLVGAGTLWHSGPPPAQKPAVSSEELAEEAGLVPRRLIVDFRDDISQGALAATGFHEVPVSSYSAVDGLYQIDFADADAAAAAAAKLARDPDVESVDYDALATIPPDEEAQEELADAQSTGSMEAECSGKAGAGDADSFPNDACYKYQWHMRQIGMPAAWKQGNGKGAVVAVIDTGVTKVGDLADTKFVAGYNFVDQQRQRRRRPRPRHARRRHHRRVDQQQARRGRRRLRRDHHAAQGSLRAGVGLDGRHLAVDPLGRRPRRQRHQHEPGRRALDGPHGQGHQVRPRQGGGRDRRGRERRAAAG